MNIENFLNIPAVNVILVSGKTIDGSVVSVVWAKPPELVHKKNVENLAAEMKEMVLNK